MSVYDLFYERQRNSLGVMMLARIIIYLYGRLHVANRRQILQKYRDQCSVQLILTSKQYQSVNYREIRAYAGLTDYNAPNVLPNLIKELFHTPTQHNWARFVSKHLIRLKYSIN